MSIIEAALMYNQRMIILVMLISFVLSYTQLHCLANKPARTAIGLAILAIDMATWFALYLDVSLDTSVAGGSYLAIVLLGLTMDYKQITNFRAIRATTPVQRLQKSSKRALSYIFLAQCAALGALYLDPQLLSNVVSTASFLLAFVMVACSAYYARLYRVRSAASNMSDKELPTVSILIPARDETNELVSCLDSLTELDYKKLEILVLDDCSANSKTSEIIKGYARQGVRFIKGHEPSSAWLGKNNAYEKLRKEASGDWLVFLGTDIRLNKHTLRNLMSYLLQRDLKMVSVLPIRDPLSLVLPSSPLRYWWEFVLPRGLMNRPPVLSSFWVIKASRLDAFGGFKGVSRSIIPERHLARFAGNDYQFLAADPDWLMVTTAKKVKSRYKTAMLHRYPQLKRRVERVMAVTAVFILGAYGLINGLTDKTLWPMAALAILAVMVSVLLPAAAHYRVNAWLRFVLSPYLLLQEIVLINYSMYRYEFTKVLWKGRNVCLPLMRVYQKLPDID